MIRNGQRNWRRGNNGRRIFITGMIYICFFLSLETPDAHCPKPQASGYLCGSPPRAFALLLLTTFLLCTQFLTSRSQPKDRNKRFRRIGAARLLSHGRGSHPTLLDTRSLATSSNSLSANSLYKITLIVYYFSLKLLAPYLLPGHPLMSKHKHQYTRICPLATVTLKPQ